MEIVVAQPFSDGVAPFDHHDIAIVEQLAKTEIVEFGKPVEAIGIDMMERERAVGGVAA